MRQLLSASDDPMALCSKLNAMLQELYAVSALGGDPYLNIPFSTSVSLTNPVGATMPATTITGPLQFSPAPGAVRNCSTQVLLTADGVAAHIPTFSGFQQAPGSASWVNTAGAVHAVTFTCDAWGILSYRIGT